MKKIVNVLMLTLAMNFLALAGGVGWLYRNGNLDKTRITAIKAILFPTTAPTTQESAPAAPEPATQPTLPLEQFLAAKSGMNSSEQVEFLQKSFDAQMIELDRKRRDAEDLLNQVRNEQEAISLQRQALATAQKKLEASQAQTTKLQNDKGFKETLERYSAMPSKTVKQIFIKMDDKTVMAYLEAMPPRNVAQIVKEFKSPEELKFIRKVLEEMRLQASVKE